MSALPTFTHVAAHATGTITAAVATAAPKSHTLRRKNRVTIPPTSGGCVAALAARAADRRHVLLRVYLLSFGGTGHAGSALSEVTPAKSSAGSPKGRAVEGLICPHSLPQESYRPP